MGDEAEPEIEDKKKCLPCNNSETTLLYTTLIGNYGIIRERGKDYESVMEET